MRWIRFTGCISGYDGSVHGDAVIDADGICGVNAETSTTTLSDFTRIEYAQGQASICVPLPLDDVLWRLGIMA